MSAVEDPGPSNTQPIPAEPQNRVLGQRRRHWQRLLFVYPLAFVISLIAASALGRRPNAAGGGLMVLGVTAFGTLILSIGIEAAWERIKRRFPR